LPPAGKHADQTEPRAHLPNPADALTEIPHAYSGELVTAWFKPHSSQLLARPALVLRALGNPRMQLLKPAGELVASALEIAEVQ
jgi:hypothetical protein